MKPYNNEFLDLLGDCAPSATPLSEPEVQRLYRLAARSGLKASPPRRRLRLLLIAAAITTSLLIAAATYYSVSDAFRGVLREQNAAGEPAPLSSMAPVVDKSGTLVEETVRSQDLEVTVRGIVGDDSGFQILLDIVDPTGTPLGIEQPDGSLSRDDLQFGSVKIRTGETKDEPGYMNLYSPWDCYFGPEAMGSGGYDRSLFPPNGNKATMLIAVNVTTSQPLAGNTLYLTLTDLKQIAFLTGTEVGMGENALFDIVSEFGPLSSSDFRESGGYHDYETGESFFYYELITDSGKAVPLAPGLPGYSVTNAGVRDGIVYLRGTAPIQRGGALFENPQLWNPQTGEYILFSGGGEGEEDQGEVTWTLQFEGAASPEALKGFVLVEQAGQGLHLLREGTWEFTIPLDYEDTTRQFQPNQAFTIEGFAMTARELTISPYHVSLKASVEEAVYKQMMYREHPIQVDWHPLVTGQTEWDKVESSATITMKDGSRVHLPMGGGGGWAEDFSIGFDLQVVIDPGQIESFAFGDWVFVVS